MIKRGFDVAVSVVALVLLAPLLVLVAIAVRAASPGPALYRARRIGSGGAPFDMLKFRTMHVGADRGAAISAGDDPRLHALGGLLRRTKIDELPQLVNVLAGQMSIVGPRPEDPRIVERCYAPAHMATLDVRPGLTSPGTLYYAAHCEHAIGVGDEERVYVEQFLPVKLALDAVYVRNAGLLYDLRLVVRTAWVIACRALRRRTLPEPPEMRRIGPIVPVRSSGPMPPGQSSPHRRRAGAGGQSSARA